MVCGRFMPRTRNFSYLDKNRVVSRPEQWRAASDYRRPQLLSKMPFNTSKRCDLRLLLSASELAKTYFLD